MVAMRVLLLSALVLVVVRAQDATTASFNDGGPSHSRGRCYCPQYYSPVCGANGQTYGNRCEARCARKRVKCDKACPCEDEKLCACPALWAPICGTDGKTYSNEQCAKCDDVEVACRGECPCQDPACICPAVEDPVCGRDGQTYGNSCLAGCANVGVACKGSCPCKDGSISNPRGEKLRHCMCLDCLAPVIFCGSNPCDGARCPAHPNAECKPDYCKGCDAYDFFVGGKKVDCNACICTREYAPVCGVDGKTYGNACSAGCDGTEIACKGECPCKPECDIVNCFVDPCQFATCPAYPNAECVANYCGGCNAEFFVGGKRVNCDEGSNCLNEGHPCSPSSFFRRSGNTRGSCCSGLTCCGPCTPIDRPVQYTTTTSAITTTCQKRCPVCRG